MYISMLHLLRSICLCTYIYIIGGSHRTTGRVWTLGEADKLIRRMYNAWNIYVAKKKHIYGLCNMYYILLYDNDDNGLYNINS